MTKFIYHFNRFNASRSAKDIWTVRFNDKNHHCKKIICSVEIETFYKGDTAKQPRAYLSGNANKIKIKNGIIRIE